LQRQSPLSATGGGDDGFLDLHRMVFLASCKGMVKISNLIGKSVGGLRRKNIFIVMIFLPNEITGSYTLPDLRCE
jgi:hypothetical protein